MEQMEQLRRIFAPDATAAPCVVAPTINVPPVQSDSKRKDLAAVLAVQHVFTKAKFDEIWLVTGLDVHGNPSAYNVVYAEERMREIIEDLHGQFAAEPAESFLRNAALLLWGCGAKGLALAHFLAPEGKITTWGQFGSAYFNMWRAYSNFCGEGLAVALTDLKNRIEEIRAKCPRVAIKTLVYLTERRLARLRKLPTAAALRPALTVSAAELDEVLRTELFQHGLDVSGGDAVGGGGATVSSGGGGKRPRDNGVVLVDPMKRPKITLKDRPTLAGPEPCWNWILKKDGCAGGDCARQRKGVSTPLPHAFAPADHGNSERLYRTWVKKTLSGKRD
jgi:hypothetical protein